MSNIGLVSAGAPELVRSNQKDRFYTNYINTLLSEISRQNLPIRFWLQWQRELQLLAELTYYGLTTVFGNQTLGEEYCNTVQIAGTLTTAEGSPRQPTTPGFFRRTLAILIQTLGPYVIEKCLERVYRKIRDRNLSVALTEAQYNHLEKIVSFVEDVFNMCSRLHLALFYIHGLFYHFGKRLVGIRYLMLRYTNQLNPDGSASQMDTYRVLGWLLLLQLFLRFLWWLWRKRKTERGESEPGTEGLSHDDGGGSLEGDPEPQVTVLTREAPAPERASLKCALCLEACKTQTATPCGHVFCWQCIIEWTSEKAECPICRSGLEPQQLVCLQHFSV